MFSYVLKRLALLVITFIGITFVTFIMVKLAPGDPVSLKLAFQEGVKTGMIGTSLKKNEESVELPAWLEKRLSSLPSTWRHGSEWLAKNTIYFGQWFTQVARLDFGLSSKDHRPVMARIKEALPVTLLLNVISLVLVYTISVPLGIWSACRRDTGLDRGAMLAAFVLYSLPTFWVATLLLMLFSSGEYLDWLPLTGIVSDNWSDLSFPQKAADLGLHLVLPIFCLTYGSLAFLSRFCRTTYLDVAGQDYMRTARAKGLSAREIVWKHGFRNTLIPLLTLMESLLPALIGGSVIIEQIFGIPGMGQLGFEAVLSRDRNLIMGISTISAFLTLCGLLLTDLLYTWADPRITYGGKA